MSTTRTVFFSCFFLLLLAALGYGGYRLYLAVQAKQAAHKAATTLPYNPFAQEETGLVSSFQDVSGATPTPINPFAEPTTAYQNPFSTTPAGSQQYKNPFEALR